MVAPQPDKPPGVLVIMTDHSNLLSEQDSVRAAEYALGVMQGIARDEFARRLAQEPRLAEAVRQWDENFVSFAEDIAPEQPPRHIEAALQRRLFATTSSQQKPSLWNSLSFWRGLAAASFAAVLALGAWTLQPAIDPVAGSAMVAQVEAAQSKFKLVAYYSETKGELRLNRVEGTAGSGRSFELWLIAGQDAPVSLGVLKEAAAVSVPVPAELRQKFKGGILAVSDEPAGGSPTGAPTGTILATGPLTEI
jgi:anti-sigma-K factor RskA